MNTNLRYTTKRATRLLTGAVCALVLAASAAHGSVRWATLEAIHQIENPTDSPRYGSCGELGAYQFKPETWSMHSREPFRRALERSASDAVAVRHYEWIKAGLEKAGVTATPYMIGLAWNGGLDGAVSGRAPRMAREYAQRVANLSAALNRDASAAPAGAASPAATATSAPTTAPVAAATLLPASAPIAAAAPAPAAVKTGLEIPRFESQRLNLSLTLTDPATTPLALMVPAAKPTPFLPTKPFLVAVQ